MTLKEMITICDLLEENLTEFDELQADDGKWLDVHEALYEISEELRKRQWIPVSERLPEAGEYVGDVAKYYLVQNEFGDMLVARYTHSGYWEQIYQYKPCADEIVAWMPLPDPYKEEQE